MKVFKIPVWDNSTGLTHIATSWQVATDIDFENIIYEVIDSTKYLNFIALNVDVPVGKVYYIRAKRKFKEVDNIDWIPPLKIINDDTSTSEIIKPSLNIEQPFINNYSVDYENGLTINLASYIGSVPHKATSWVIKDINTGEILYKSMYDTNNLLSITIPNDDVDFSKLDSIVSIITFHGDLSIDSSPNIEVLDLYKTYFTIDANKKIVPSDIDYIGKIIQKTEREVKLISAELFNLEGKKIADGEIDNNIFKFYSRYLIPNMSYTVKLKLNYTWYNKDIYVRYSFFTKSMTEKIIFNKEREYNKTFTYLINNDYIVYDPVNNDLSIDGLNSNIDLITEQTYVGIIPMFSTDSKLKAYVLDKNNNRFTYVKNIEGFNKKVNNYLKIELLPNNKLYIDTIVNNKNTMYIYKFNPYTFKLTYLNTIVRHDEYVNTNNTNSYGVLQGELYYCSVDINDNTKIFIRKINKDTDLLETIYYGNLDNNLKINNVVFNRIDLDRFIIIPQNNDNDNNIYGYVFNLDKNSLSRRFTIPIEVRNKNIFSIILDNGNLLLIRKDLEDSKLYYVIIDVDISNGVYTYYKEFDYDDLLFNNLVKLKSGNFIIYNVKENKGISLLWS